MTRTSVFALVLGTLVIAVGCTSTNTFPTNYDISQLEQRAQQFTADVNRLQTEQLSGEHEKIATAIDPEVAKAIAAARAEFETRLDKTLENAKEAAKAAEKEAVARANAELQKWASAALASGGEIGRFVKAVMAPVESEVESQGKTIERTVGNEGSVTRRLADIAGFEPDKFKAELEKNITLAAETLDGKKGQELKAEIVQQMTQAGFSSEQIAQIEKLTPDQLSGILATGGGGGIDRTHRPAADVREES